MPCFSTIQTVLIDLAALQKAADNLGMQLIKRNADTYTLSKGTVSAYLQRSGEGQKFTASNASYNFNSEVLRPISQEYAKVTQSQPAPSQARSFSPNIRGSMAKRQVKILITPQGEIKVDNAGNPDERRILDELAELAQILNGDSTGFEVEKHVHTHGGHAHTHTHVGGKSNA